MKKASYLEIIMFLTTEQDHTVNPLYTDTWYNDIL